MRELSIKPRNIKRHEQARLDRIKRAEWACVWLDTGSEPYPADDEMTDLLQAFAEALDDVVNGHIDANKFMVMNDGKIVIELGR